MVRVRAVGDRGTLEVTEVVGQRVDKAELALTARRKAIFDHNPKNKRPTAMPIDTVKNGEEQLVDRC